MRRAIHAEYDARDACGEDFAVPLPQGWAAKRLRFCIKFNPHKTELRDLSGDVHGSFVPMEAVGEYGGMHLSQTKPIEEMLSGYTYFRDGDVVVAKITPCFENGKGAVAELLENGIGFGTTELHVLRPMPDMDKRYLFYLTISHHFRHIGAANMLGSAGQKRVPEDFIRNLKTPIPPLPEQSTIAAFLDRETERIDSLIAKKQRQIELLNEKRTAIISHAVTKGLNPDAKMKDSGIEWPGAIPEKWEVKRLKYLILCIEQGWSPQCEARLADPHEWGVLKSGCVNGGFYADGEHKALPVDLEPIKSLEIKRGDVLMSRASGSRELIGSVALVHKTRERLMLSDKLFRLHSNGKSNAKFLCYAMNARYVRSQIENSISGAEGLANNLPQKDLKNFWIVCPSLDQQQIIADYLQIQSKMIDALIAKVQASIGILQEYRTALITAAVTGKIDVRQEATHAKTAH